MTFSAALESVKLGYRVTRAGWNGKGMWIGLVRGLDAWPSLQPWVGQPWIGMKTADGSFVPWTASQTDLLAEDWVLLSETMP